MICNTVMYRIITRGLGLRLMFSATLPLVYYRVPYCNIIMIKIFLSLQEQSAPRVSHALRYETKNCVKTERLGALMYYAVY